MVLKFGAMRSKPEDRPLNSDVETDWDWSDGHLKDGRTGFVAIPVINLAMKTCLVASRLSGTRFVGIP